MKHRIKAWLPQPETVRNPRPFATIAARAMTKILFACLTLLLASCGLVTSQSIYEGFRTQQSAKDAGKQPAEKMDPYDAYEKERAKITSPERSD